MNKKRRLLTRRQNDLRRVTPGRRRHFYLISGSNLHQELSEKLPKMFLIKSCCSFEAATRISAVLNGAWVLAVRTAHYERITLSPSNFFSAPYLYECECLGVARQRRNLLRCAAEILLIFFFSFFIPSSGGAASCDSSSRNPKMGSTEVQILCHCTFLNVDFSGIRTVFLFLCDPKHSGCGVTGQYVFNTEERN